MILNLDGQPLGRRIQRRNFGDRPGFVNAIQLKPQIEMQSCCGMALNDETQFCRLAARDMTARLGSYPKIPFRAVCLQSRHQTNPSADSVDCAKAQIKFGQSTPKPE
jgi:hypothetical protein